VLIGFCDQNKIQTPIANINTVNYICGVNLIYYRMKNKQIQEERMKNYFIQAAKDILKSEGIKAISVRNIADRAGYSYTTLYNYFRDVNDLIFECVNDFQQECAEYVSQKTDNSLNGYEAIKAKALAYVQYFVEYPGIFDLFYLTTSGDLGYKQKTLDIIARSFELICEPDWAYLTKNNISSGQIADKVKKQIGYTVMGALLLYLNRQTPAQYSAFMDHVESQIGYVLD
jgi:AcrR family transcriptional regulator